MADETKTPGGLGPEKAKGYENDGKNVIDEAREEREKLEKVRDELKAEREKAEKVAVQMQLAGKSRPAAPIEETEAEKYERSAGERYRGTGMNPARGYKRKWD